MAKKSLCNSKLETCIKIENLYVSYDKNYIIKGIDMEIPKNQITAIIGSNGCGKSTLLKTISRILPVKKGNIILNAENIKNFSNKQIARKIAVLPQSPIAPAGLLVKELVAYGRFPYQTAMGGLNKKDIDIIKWSMDVTDISSFADMSMDSLSGGQRQRVWIAMILAQDTEILILDEPTTYLDIAHQLEILNLLQRLNKEQNRTVIMVLHEVNNAIKFSNYIIGMKEGKIIFSGEPLNVITSENLKQLYGVNVNLQLDETKSFPICLDFNLSN